jgi:histidine triad (HIT) family protein
MDECVFCRIAAKSIPAKIVHEDETLVAFEDIHPQSPVHILIIPRAHMSSLNDALEDDAELLGALVLAAAKIAKSKGIATDGYRLVVNTMAGAGQTVFHLHVHLLGGRRMSFPSASIPR